MNIKQITIDSNEIVLGDIFTNGLQNYLKRESVRVGIQFEFLVPGLLPTVAHLMNETDVKVADDHIESCVLYTALIANPSTGKSSSINVLKNAVYDIEKYEGINAEDSNLVNGATVEAICTILGESNCILSLFDEGSTFLGSFGRYTGGGAAYDRGIYLELFNAKSVFRRDLKAARTVVHNPRLNICLLGHPHNFIKAIKEEVNAYEDGLMQRFLSCCPKPVFYTSAEINQAREITREITITVLLYTIKLLHNRMTLVKETNEEVRKTIVYCFNDESKLFFNDMYTEYRQVCAKMNNHDNFISAMFGKAITHVIRLSAILQATENAYEVLKTVKCGNKHILSIEIKNALNAAIENASINLYEIKYQTIFAAKSMVEYFMLNRLILAGYKTKMHSKVIGDHINLIINSVLTKSSIFKNGIQKKIAEEIFRYPGAEVVCNDLVQAKKGTAEDIIGVFEVLKLNGLGTWHTTRANERGKETKIFKKLNPERLIENSYLISIIEEEIELDLKLYIDRYNMVLKKKGVVQTKSVHQTQTEIDESQTSSTLDPEFLKLSERDLELNNPLSSKHRLVTMEQLIAENDNKKKKNADMDESIETIENHESLEAIVDDEKQDGTVPYNKTARKNATKETKRIMQTRSKGATGLSSEDL